MLHNRPVPVLFLSMALLLIVFPSSALYSFEGIPLEITAQGAVQGDVVQSWKMGTDAPPYTHQFVLDKQPVFARVYTGIWGGTEQYRGWAQVEINGKKQERITLYGRDDMSEQVYVSGHGVYWLSADATGLVREGPNTVTVTTSRGEPGNKLDGRVYGILVIALVETSEGPVTQYWIAEGNENLHGEGWAGTNPTRHESCAVTFPVTGPASIRRADLTAVLLTSTRGQPDYITLNGRDLGVPAAPAAEYLPGARDIGNERSSDATGGTGTDSRYADLEIFDVTSLISGSTTVVFERGRDLNGDGGITTTGTLSEGEDYIHPVFSLLTVQGDSAAFPTDLSVDPVTVRNAYEGERATISTTIRNNGRVPSGPADLVFSVDNTVIDSRKVMIGYEGISEVEGSWEAVSGVHTVSVSVALADDPVSSNNVVSRTVRVGSPPDLSVSLGDPITPGVTSAQGIPFPLAGSCAGGLILLWWMGKRKGGVPAPLPAVLVVCGLVAVSAVPAVTGAGSGISEFTIPVTITNSGGSDAPPFFLTFYLDGEKVSEHEVQEGVPAGGTITVRVPLFAASGRHTLRVAVDERGTILEKDRSNNSAERVYEFS